MPTKKNTENMRITFDSNGVTIRRNGRACQYRDAKKVKSILESYFKDNSDYDWEITIMGILGTDETLCDELKRNLEDFCAEKKPK